MKAKAGWKGQNDRPSGDRTEWSTSATVGRRAARKIISDRAGGSRLVIISNAHVLGVATAPARTLAPNAMATTMNHTTIARPRDRLFNMMSLF